MHASNNFRCNFSDKDRRAIRFEENRFTYTHKIANEIAINA